MRPRVMLRFKADAYIQVREKGGPVLLNRVMRTGETWPVPREANLVMTTGNAGGTDIVVDGVTAASLGSLGRGPARCRARSGGDQAAAGCEVAAASARPIETRVEARPRLAYLRGGNRGGPE